jgi:hypothetical protein
LDRSHIEQPALVRRNGDTVLIQLFMCKKFEFLGVQKAVLHELVSGVRSSDVIQAALADGLTQAENHVTDDLFFSSAGRGCFPDAGFRRGALYEIDPLAIA